MRGHGFRFQSCVEVGLGFGGRDVPDGLLEAAVVEPADPFEGCVFDGLEVSPRTTTVDDLGVEEPVDRLGQRIVIAVADAANRGFDTRFGQAFGIAYGQILAATVAVVNQPHAFGRAALMDCLFEGIEDETCMGRSADTPAHDAAGLGVDDESHTGEPFPIGDIGEVAHPEHVRGGAPELAVHLVQRARRLLVRDRRPVRLAPD